MYLIVGAIIAVILILIIGVFYVQMQDTKKRVEKHKALMEHSRLIQSDFKQQAQILIDATIINSQQKQKLCYLANNFFVFQSVNDIGLKNLEKLTDYFSGIVTTAMSAELSERLIEIFANSANKVPTSARDFTASFYTSRATQILTVLKNDLDAYIKGDEPEEESAGDSTNQSGEASSSTNDDKSETSAADIEPVTPSEPTQAPHYPDNLEKLTQERRRN